MLREVDLKEISNGQLYYDNDMVRADTKGCVGCTQSCCIDMGTTIVLDPLDVHNLCQKTGKTLEQLLERELELHMVDGRILPNIRMQENKHCAFLDANQRCLVHEARPGICRLFPLGRYWESDTAFAYILQTNQCPKTDLTKIKVKKWLDRENLTDYNKYVCLWHQFLKEVARAQQTLAQGDELAEQMRILNMYLLRLFYMQPYKNGEFYADFCARVEKARKDLAINV